MTLERTEKLAKLTPHVSKRTAMIAPILASVLAFGFAVLQPVAASAQANGEAGSLELVDPNVFRACGDPRNLPFSNDKGE